MAQPAGRVTIKDVAAAAGVSIGAVSYALNGRPGVSDDTRRRVLEVAERLAWRPERSARNLARRTSDCIGLVISRPSRMLGTGPYFVDLIDGVEDTLAAHRMSLILHRALTIDDEIATYRGWASERRVDGVIVVDVQRDDARLPVLRALGLPCLVVSSDDDDLGVPTLWLDQEPGLDDAVAALAAAGHRDVARVGGRKELVGTAVRDALFRRAVRAAGLRPRRVLHTDFSPAAGAAATSRLLRSATPPTAVVYENAVMCLAGLAAARDLGVTVPEHVSMLACDDAEVLEYTHPAVSAIANDVVAAGRQAATLLLESIGGADAGVHRLAVRTFRDRGSIAAPARRG